MHALAWFSNSETLEEWYRIEEGRFRYWQKEARKARRQEEVAKMMSNDLRQYDGLACRSLAQKLEERNTVKGLTTSVRWNEIADRLLRTITSDMK